MNDDFNTPEAIAVLGRITTALNRAKADKKPEEVQNLADLLKLLGGILGILQHDPKKWRRDVTITLTGHQLNIEQGNVSVDPHKDEVRKLIADRDAARKAKNWAESDRIRHKLEELGFVPEDGPQGTTWRRK
jgi:cysteinyl-tRNA synthetase